MPPLAVTFVVVLVVPVVMPGSMMDPTDGCRFPWPIAGVKSGGRPLDGTFSGRLRIGRLRIGCLRLAIALVVCLVELLPLEALLLFSEQLLQRPLPLVTVAAFLLILVPRVRVLLALDLVGADIDAVAEASCNSCVPTAMTRSENLLMCTSYSSLVHVVAIITARTVYTMTDRY